MSNITNITNVLLATNLKKKQKKTKGADNKKAKSDYPNKAVAQDYSPPSPGK